MTNIEQYVEILDEVGLKHSEIKTRDNGKQTVTFMYQTELMGKPVSVMVTCDSCSVEQTVFGIANIPEDKITNAILMCNDLNAEYRFLKFYVDEENNVVVEDDAFLDEHSAGAEIFAVTKIMLEKLNDIYGRFMKAIWA